MSKHCGVPHPTYSSYRCQKPEGHDGAHVGRRGKRSRHWQPYLPLYNALMRGART